MTTFQSGYLTLDIVDEEASRNALKGEAMEAWIEVCAAHGHRPTSKPAFRFIPGVPSQIRIETTVAPATRSWVEAVIAA